MLNPRTHPLHQETELLKIGEFIVDLPRREVGSATRAEPVRLTLKSLNVLLALVSQHGKVVSREALLEWVWPDTLPTDDVLTQAIGQLRKAFCDDRESPRYLETISKGGYRLLAPVQWIERTAADIPVVAEAPATPSDATPVEAVPPDTAPLRSEPREAATLETATSTASPPARSRTALWVAAALGVLALVSVAWHQAVGPKAIAPATVAANPTEEASEPLNYVTITSRPGRETNANLSPDGAMVAYQQVNDRNNSTIMLQTTVHVPARQLTATPPGYSDAMPVWSPDGRMIAFVRFDTDSRCQIMLVAPSGGNERKIADCFAGTASSFDWTPDGKGLLMGLEARLPGERNSPLRMLDIASGQWRALAYPIADNDIDIDPRYSPDGKWIVFRRSISLSDLWKMPAGGGTPQRLTHVKSDIRGWDWLPDSSGLVFSYIGNAVGMFRYDLASGAVTRLKMDVFAVFPDIARHSSTLAFTVDQSTSGLFRVKLPKSPGESASRERLFPSSRSDMLGALSPDDRSLAFISDRGSRLELWLGQLDKPDSARVVEEIMPVPRHLPVWSADGSRLLVVGNQTGQQSLYEVEVDSGRLHLLPVPAPSPIYAAYTADPNQLLVGSDGGDGRLRVVLYDRSASPWRELASLPDVALVRYDAARQRIYFTRATKPGTWSANPRLQDVQVLDPLRPRVAKEYKRWGITPDGPYFMDWSEECALGWIKLGAPATQVARCLDPELEAWPLSPSIDRAGTSMVLTLDVSNNSDIGLADIAGMTSGLALEKKKSE